MTATLAEICRLKPEKFQFLGSEIGGCLPDAIPGLFGAAVLGCGAGWIDLSPDIVRTLGEIFRFIHFQGGAFLPLSLCCMPAALE
jgi:hypothetical protein